MSCELCERKARAGPNRWNGPGRSHCNDCHADWPFPSNAMHCVRCHLTFGSPKACDLHDWPTGCVAPESVGMVGKPNRWGTEVWWPVGDEVAL